MGNGWVIYAVSDGSYGVVHTSGFFVAGFADRAEAGFWLQDYMLRRAALQYRHERARERILARLQPQGRVS